MPVGNAFIGALLDVVYTVLDFYIWCLIIGAVLSWLVAFNIVNPYSRFVRTVGDFIARITEPALQRIRKILPPMGGIDLAPMVLIILIWFLKINDRFHLVFISF